MLVFEQLTGDFNIWTACGWPSGNGDPFTEARCRRLSCWRTFRQIRSVLRETVHLGGRLMEPPTARPTVRSVRTEFAIVAHTTITVIVTIHQLLTVDRLRVEELLHIPAETEFLNQIIVIRFFDVVVK